MHQPSVYLLFLRLPSMILFPSYSVSSLRHGLTHFQGFTCHVYLFHLKIPKPFSVLDQTLDILEPSVQLHTGHPHSRSLKQTELRMTTASAFPLKLTSFLLSFHSNGVSFTAGKPGIMRDPLLFLMAHLSQLLCPAHAVA